MKKYHLLLLSILSGILLALAWPERGFPGLLFVGMVPLLYVEYFISLNPGRFGKFSALFYAYPAFFTWNLLTTWWIVNSTVVGALMAVVLNSLFMAIVFQLYSWVKKMYPNRVAGYLAFISFWIAFEYLHLNWILTWPWLNLGNGFAAYYRWVQWYEYTGALGGTLWALAGNILLFEGLRSSQFAFHHSQVAGRTSHFALRISPMAYPYLFAFLLWIGLPLGLSYLIYYSYTEKTDPVRFVVVQPNIDPYSEQYSLPPATVMERIMALAAPLLDTSTNLLVAPESAIQEKIWENYPASSPSLALLQDVVAEYPSLNVVIGASTFWEFEAGQPLTRTARKFTQSEGYYDAYNTAILINSSDSVQLYHKSKLTPGVEAMPSFRGFKWLENFALDLGGTVGSLGTDELRKVYATEKSIPLSAVICYESAFGEFFAEFVRNGAQVMIIITNDGWWANTAGHRQHYAFAHLRAIETRRSIARSANTGISAFIDQRGEATGVTAYWVPAAIKGELNVNREITFYVRYGDYIARVAVLVTGLLLLVSLVFTIFATKAQRHMVTKSH